jgi:hypothetical protein
VLNHTNNKRTMRKLLHEIWGKVEGSIPGPTRPTTALQDSQARKLALRTFSYFYSAENHQFQARTKSESTLGENDHFGYVVWPVIITVHTLAETLPHEHLQVAITCLQEYWNPARYGFCAWKMFPGNEDIYYDDNAHAAQALISAHDASGEKKFLEQAKEILANLIIPAARKDGGVPWHTNNQNARNACSTGPAAVAALRLYAIEHDHNLLVFAERALRWIIATLRDPEDGLIWDSLVFGADGQPKINKMKWTYNIGFVIHGFTLLYECTRNQNDLDTAISLSQAALNPECSLFDRCIPDISRRMYSDSSFFLHHLVDGFRVLSKHAETERLQKEIQRIATWGNEFMFDPSDSLYYRGSVPYTIDDARVQKFNVKFDLSKGLEPNGQERDEKGILCKTLIGCSSWARVLLAAENMQLIS